MIEKRLRSTLLAIQKRARAYLDMDKAILCRAGFGVLQSLILKPPSYRHYSKVYKNVAIDTQLGIYLGGSLNTTCTSNSEGKICMSSLPHACIHGVAVKKHG